MALQYSFKSAFQSLCREKWINALSILTVASSLLIIALVSLFVYNIDIAAKRLPERFSMVVYLKNNLTEEQTREIISNLDRRDEIVHLKYISKDEALQELKQTLTESSALLEGLDENPLTPSIEIRLQKEIVKSAAVQKLAEEIKKIPGIDNVYYGEKIAETVHLLKRSVQNMSMIIFVSVTSGIVFVAYSTVNILFYRRKSEIEIIALLGATGGFIRTPFIIEGGFIGLAGGILSALASLAFYFGITYNLSAAIPILGALIFPSEILFLLPAAGSILGIMGSIIAVGRLRL
jgi:cell division transport system permease protein